MLAAHLAGAKVVMFPKKNEKDLRDIPEEIRKQMKLVPVESMDQVLETALRRRPKPLPAAAAPKPAKDGESDKSPEAPIRRPNFPPDQPTVVVKG
jgi:ATP-dependent Lon protease